MDMLMTLAALLAPATLVGAALLARLQPGARPRMVERVSIWAGWIGAGAAALLGVGVATIGTIVTPTLGAFGLGLSLRFDPLSATIFAMVALLGVVILRFSKTYLDGDARQGRFLGRVCATIASVETLVLSGNLLVFALAWIATSVCLHHLLLFYADRPRARIAGRKKFIVARLGDIALVAAAALLYSVFGTGDIGVILERASTVAGAWQLEWSVALIAIAALLKSAQFPTHGWLVEVMETPTPVSALLHAGILNAGPFLVLRYASVVEVGIVGPVLLVVIGGFTALFACVVLLTQPSIKVVLGYSSAAHMGFMLLVCGLGVYPAAALHLVAHSFYKAHAFLSSGSVVEVSRASRVSVPSRLRSPARLLASIVLAGAIYLGIAVALGFSPTEHPALLAVGAILVMGIAQLLAPAIDSNGTLPGMARTAGLAVAVTLAFFILEEGTRLLLQPALPPITQPDPLIIGLTSLVLAAFAGAVLAQMIAPRTDSRLLRAAHIHIRNGLYANALFDRLVRALRQ
jgi:NAD(P)H-quinone oxidoreductase subunit 5